MKPVVREISSQLEKSTDLKLVETNPTMSSSTVTAAMKDVVDFASRKSRTKSVVLCAYVKP